MKKVVAFSLWGSGEGYLKASLDAVEQVVEQYPGWECRFYLRWDVPAEIRDLLAQKGAVIKEGPDWGPWAGMYWRFLAAGDPEVDIMISRDVDTRILPRETSAVYEWIESNAPIHIMRDHPKHEMPMMGGMWGCRALELRNIESLILNWNRFSYYGCDQEFLARVVYPRFRDSAWIHSECVVFPKERVHRFPMKREDDEVIGMAIREKELVDLQVRYLREWQSAGMPILRRPHPWSIGGRIRKITRGRWPGDSV